ncbi:MAG: MFS transporter [Sedimenticolaceae bacterium]
MAAPMPSLMVYAMPALPLAFLGLPLYVYLPAHYAGLPGLGLAAVGVVLLVARLLDLVTDPLVGLLTDRSRSLLRPQWLMTLGGLLMLAGAWWLFRPAPDAGPLFLLTTLSVTYLGWTLLAIPYYALGADLGERGNGQTAVAAWREAGMIVGTLAALILPAVMTGYGSLELSALALLWLVPPALLAGWFVQAGGAVPGAGTSGGIARMWRETSKASRQVLGIHLLNTMAGGTAATLFVLYARDVIGLDEGTSGVLLLVYFVAGLLALPLWVAYARRAGRARTWRLAMLVAALGFLPAAFLGSGDLVGFVAVCVLTGATLGADIAMPASLQAELVVSESKAMSKPRGGALFGLWGMAGKLALALAAGVALPLLALLTHPSGGLQQAEVIPWLYAGLPVLIKLLAVLALQRSQLIRSAAPAATAIVEKFDDFEDLAPADPVSSASRRL